MNLAKKQRESNIELLRIIVMFMIVAHHFSIHGNFAFDYSTLTLNRFWLQLLLMGGKIGVDVFILITGYFSIENDKIKIDKLLKLIFQVFSISIITYIIGIMFQLEPFNIKILIQHLFPITFNMWWFASTYIIFYILTPFVNKFLHNISKYEYKIFLIICTILWCILPTFTTKNFGSNDLIWFLYLYSLAGYIKRFPIKKEISCKKYIGFSLFIICLTFLSTIIFDILGTANVFFAKHAAYLYGMQEIPMVLISLSLFLGFLKIKIKSNSFINLISSTTFGIYLLHDSYFGKKILWTTIFKNSLYLNSAILIPYSICVVLIVFIGCFLIELFRLYLVEKVFSKMIMSLSRKINNLIAEIKKSKFVSEV